MKLKINPENEKYRQLAVDLSIIIGTQFSATEAIYIQDAFVFRQLIENDKNTIDEISQMITWYKYNQGPQYVPLIGSAQEFREKYHKLLQAKNKKNFKSKQRVEYPPVNLTRKSLNLFSNEKIDEHLKEYDNTINRLTEADIWRNGYKPDKGRIFSALLAQKNWINNLSYVGFNEWHLRQVIGTLENLATKYLEYVEFEINNETDFLKDGTTEGHLFPNSDFFMNCFIPDVEDGIIGGGTFIYSRGWKNDEHLKIETPPEIEARRKRNEIKTKKQKEQEAQDKETKKQNIIWIHNCMRKHLSDINKTDIDLFDFSKWTDELNKKDFEDFVIRIEKKHQENPDSRNNGYIFLWRKG